MTKMKFALSHDPPTMSERKSMYDRAYARSVNFLVRELQQYKQRFPNELNELRATLKPGDVVLVEGSQRISQIIKYLTQSSWSHAALYVGDSLIKHGGTFAEEAERMWGDEARHLMIEANLETGVAAVPLTKYMNHNLRVCRPINLRPGDLSTVIRTVIDQVGSRYNVAQIMTLLRYFVPLSLPWKRRSTNQEEIEREISNDLICSSQIAMAFQKVRYPILPAVTTSTPEGLAAGGRSVFPFWYRRFAQRSVLRTGVFTPCDPKFVTPRDFDLSPYFEIVKLGDTEKRAFDYKKMKWSLQEQAMATEFGDPEEPAAAAPPESAESPTVPAQDPSDLAIDRPTRVSNTGRRLALVVKNISPSGAKRTG